MLDDLPGLRPARKHCAPVLKRRSEVRTFGSGTMPAVAKNVIHISQAEAASDFAQCDGPSARRGQDRHRSTRTSQPTWKKSSEPQTVGSASMGVILDSSVIIAAERRGRTVRQILEQMTAPGTAESR